MKTSQIRWLFFQLASALILLSPAVAPAQNSWVALFNGKDLAGWVQHGGQAKYNVEDDCIVGTTVLNTENSFLCTEKTYSDFILEYDFKVDPQLNSGVQIRSECFEDARKVQWKGKTINIPAGRVHGYQVEIDPDVARGRMWTAGLYDEAQRLWLFPGDGETGEQGKAFSAQGKRIFRPRDWNHIRVEAVGDSIKTWLNGTPSADLRDYFVPRGFIALQVHQVGSDRSKEGIQVCWRNLRIQEVAPNTLTADKRSQGWQLLWDGKTGTGWRSAKAETFPARGWQIQDGVLTVLESGGAESASGGDIITRKRYADFELYAEFKITPGANSGIKYFVQPNLDPITGTGAVAATGSAIGLEFQVLDDERHPDAKAGRDGDRTVGSLYDLIAATTQKHVNAIGDWNAVRIVSRGKHVEHWLNGMKVLEYERGSPEYRRLVALSKYRNIQGFGEWADGHILLQDHGNRVSYRNIKIRTLPTN